MCRQERQRGEPQLVLWTLNIGDLTPGMNHPEIRMQEVDNRMIKAQEEGLVAMLAHAESPLMGQGEG